MKLAGLRPVHVLVGVLCAAVGLGLNLINRRAEVPTASPPMLLTPDQAKFLEAVKGLVDADGVLFFVVSDSVGRVEVRGKDKNRMRAAGAFMTQLGEALRAEVQPTLAQGEGVQFMLAIDDTLGFEWGPPDVHNAQWKKKYADFLHAHPNFYVLSWNPRLEDLEKGFIASHVIPVPDYYAFGECEPASLWMRLRCFFGMGCGCAARRPGIGWRGGTTGQGTTGQGVDDTYTTTDRYKAVAALAATGADVKFSAYYHGVTEEMIPEFMRGRREDRAWQARFQAELDVDGNANAWSLRNKLCSAPVLKANSRQFIQWYYPLLENGKHLVVANTEDLPTALERVIDGCDSFYGAGKEFSERLTEAQTHDASDVGEVKMGLRGILRGFRSYETPRDWRIRNTAHLFENPV
eukprot:TRINITY_DN2774_c0_g1_i1.p1 TRINITY_DN2774_c0_g1~~TRINITY_DN2774_c0_g1_i1.p1  ORF type:complete len:406 (+),score=83.25 TRINITY_DN2774_c0_g1_i1:49-1266(+)